MDPLRLLAEARGFITRGEVRAAGLHDRDIARMKRTKVWHTIRRGYYTFTDIWQTLDPVARHRVHCCAVLHSLGDRVALSHVSGCVAHGIAVWGIPLDRVHVTRLDGGAGRTEGDVVHHEGVCLADDVIEKEGLLVLSPERCAIEAGSTATNEQALVLFNSLLHQGLATGEELHGRFDLMQHWPRCRHLHIPVRLADSRAESAGESRGLWLFWANGLPLPQLQYEVVDAAGVVRGTCDWAWEDHALLGEFDGRVKYGRLLKPGQEPGDVVFAEKRREDVLREISGSSMIRLIWTDYSRPKITADRIRTQLRRLG